MVESPAGEYPTMLAVTAPDAITLYSIACLESIQGALSFHFTAFERLLRKN
jgi:hypothetical protein